MGEYQGIRAPTRDLVLPFYLGEGRRASPHRGGEAKSVRPKFLPRGSPRSSSASVGGHHARDSSLKPAADPFLHLRSSTTMASNVLNNLAKGAVGIGAGISLFQSSIYNVDGGFRAVMFDRLRGVQVCSSPRTPPRGAKRDCCLSPTCMHGVDARRSTSLAEWREGRGHALPHTVAADAAHLRRAHPPAQHLERHRYQGPAGGHHQPARPLPARQGHAAPDLSAVR